MENTQKTLTSRQYNNQIKKLKNHYLKAQEKKEDAYHTEMGHIKEEALRLYLLDLKIEIMSLGSLKILMRINIHLRCV